MNVSRVFPITGGREIVKWYIEKFLEKKEDTEIIQGNRIVHGIDTGMAHPLRQLCSHFPKSERVSYVTQKGWI